MRDTLRLSRIGGTLGGRVRIALVRTLFVLNALTGRMGGSRVVTVREGGRRLRFTVADVAELEVLREVFLEREYELELRSDPAFILDVGSNIGASIAFFRTRYPSARIVGLEPDPRAFARLRANVADLDVTVLRVAAAAEDGRREFHPASATWLSSFDVAAEAAGAIEVEARALDSLIGELGVERVDLLKIDVEGAEAEILPAFSGLASVGAIVGEIHPDVVPDPEATVRLVEERFDVQVDRRTPARWRFRGTAR